MSWSAYDTGGSIPTIAAKERAGPLRGSSRDNRQNKQNSLTAQVVGTNPLPALTFGLIYGAYIDPDLVLQLEFAYGRSTQGEIFTNIAEERRFNSIGIHAKQFLGNSFYFVGGLDYMRFDYKYSGSEYWFTINGSKPETSLSGGGSSLTSSIRIGNQWQWSNFTLGCDWVGINVPLVVDLNSETETNPEVSQSRKQAFRDRNSNMFGKR